MRHQLDAALCPFLRISLFVEKAARHQLGFPSILLSIHLFSVGFRCRFTVTVGGCRLHVATAQMAGFTLRSSSADGADQGKLS